MTLPRFLDVHLSIRFGRDQPEQEQHDTVTDALVEHGERRPIGFWPDTDPTRHLDPEDAGLIDWLRRLWCERNQLEDDLRAAINRPDMED